MARRSRGVALLAETREGIGMLGGVSLISFECTTTRCVALDRKGVALSDLGHGVYTASENAHSHTHQ